MHSVRPFIIRVIGSPRLPIFLGTILILSQMFAWGATRRPSTSGKTSTVDRPQSRPAPETVFVREQPPQSPAPLFLNSSFARDQDHEDRRTRVAFNGGPTRDFRTSYGLFGGFYNAEVLGSNPYANFFWNIYPGQESYFFEFTSGVGTVQSSFSKSVVGGGVFPHSFMITTEALGGYTYSGLSHGAGRAAGLFPYFNAGITAIYQGGVPNIGGVLGWGNRMNLPFGPSDGRWALNIAFRDHIYSQKIRSAPSITQNFILLIGVQKYY